MRRLCLKCQRPASAKISDGRQFIALAIRSTLSRVTLRSPRSILPMCERSMLPGLARIGEEDLVFSRAGTPAALPLGFVVQHFLMKEVGDTLALEVLTSVEEGIGRDHS